MSLSHPSINRFYFYIRFMKIYITMFQHTDRLIFIYGMKIENFGLFKNTNKIHIIEKMNKYLVALLLIGYCAAQTCTTVQYWSIATDTTSMYPTTPVIQFYDLDLTLKDIPFTDGVNQYTLQQVKAISTIPGYRSTAALPVVTLDVIGTFTVTFSVVDSTAKTISQGTADVGVNKLQVVISEGAGPTQWAAQAPSVEINTPSTNLLLTVNALYQQIQVALNTGDTAVAAQITTQLTAPTSLTVLNDKISTYLSDLYGNSYSYSYKNINGVAQNIEYKTSVMPPSTYKDNALILQRILSVQGITNQCEEAMAQPSTTQGNVTVTQISAFSQAQVRTTFDYALAQGFFDSVLNENWNSPIFQFNVASLSNVLGGLSGQYEIFKVMVGNCIAAAVPNSEALTLNEDGSYPVNLKYTCTINKPTGTGSVLTVAFKLSGNVRITADSQKLLVVGSGFSAVADSIVFTEVPQFPLQNKPLAIAYIQSLVASSLNGQNLFGSGFSTLPRQAAKVGSVVTAQDVIVFETV